jgi:hypothetical protein
MTGGLPHFSGGGILGDITGAIGGAAGAVGGAIGGAAGWVKNHLNPIDWLIGALKGPLAKLSQLTDTSFGQMVASVPTKLGSDMVDFAKSLIGLGSGPAAGSPSPGGPAASGQVANWIDQALGLMGMSLSFEPGIASLIMHESGGNPSAINLWDSNAKAGHPSQGLMQTIPGTFHEYVLPALASMPITDPVANITAGVRYALANYGPGMLMAGGRHDPSGAYIGYDQGGWLQPGFTPVWNGTGAPEPVLNPQQWETVKAGTGHDGELLAAIGRIESLLAANPELVAAGVAGEFERAVVTHARETVMAARTF